MTRRQFLSRLMALGVMPVAMSEALATAGKRELWVSAVGDNHNTYSLGWMGADLKQTKTVLSGFRGHGASQHPLKKSSILMYGRRPATTCIEVDLETQSIKATIEAEKHRHFFGHGCFSKDGKTLFTAEADYKYGKGKIGIRDAMDYQLLGEYESYGVGPHEIKLMPDGKTLVIANGGILTHPDSGRKELNLDSMQSSLTYLDIETGKLLDDFRVPESKASIRHLDVADDGSVALAMQVQRVATEHQNLVPLAAIHKPGKPIRLLTGPENLLQQMNDYMGSVAINNQSRLAGFTSPKGNVAAFWNIDNGDFSGYHALQDVCGLTVSQNQQYFLISNSFGQIRHLDAATLKEDKARRIILPNTRWDNHLLSVSV